MKIVKETISVLKTAWYVGLIIYCATVFSSGIFRVASKFLNNGIVSCTILGISLIMVSIWLEKMIGQKISEAGSCPNRTTKLGRTRRKEDKNA